MIFPTELIFQAYLKKKKNAFEKVIKGGNEQMNVKSRYEVIADLEAKKREYLNSEMNQNEVLKGKKNNLRDLKREVEDTEQDIKDFEASIKTNIETNKLLIKSVDESLKRFENLKENK